jgi:hypothetical protein
MKYIAAMVLGIMMFTSAAFSAEPQITQYRYNLGDALHPFKLMSLAVRPPVALANVIVRSGYWVLDVDSIRRAFNIEYSTSQDIDEDY